MASQAPRAADEDFEARLAWSPSGESGSQGLRPASRPGSTPRPPAPAASGPRPDRQDDDALAAIRSALEAIRAEVQVLQQAGPSGSPDLDELIAEVRELRKAVMATLERTPARPSGRSAGRAAAAAADGAAPTGADLSALTEEVVQLRRRISLRASSTELDDSTVERIADAVVARIVAEPALAPPLATRRGQRARR